jgi:hypothetical protein
VVVEEAEAAAAAVEEAAVEEAAPVEEQAAAVEAAAGAEAAQGWKPDRRACLPTAKHAASGCLRRRRPRPQLCTSCRT